MSDYVKTLEDKNDELSKLLAASEAKQLENIKYLKYLESLQKMSVEYRNENREPHIVDAAQILHPSKVTSEAYNYVKDNIINKNLFPQLSFIPRIIIYNNGEWELALSSIPKFNENE